MADHCTFCPFAVCPECDYQGGTVRFVTSAGGPERMAGPTENGPETVRQHHVSQGLTTRLSRSRNG